MILNLESPADVLSPNGPCPLKNGLFLVYSTIAEIRGKFDHFGPQKGRWARNVAFSLKNSFFLVYSTKAEIRCKFDHFGKFDPFEPQKGRGVPGRLGGAPGRLEGGPRTLNPKSNPKP